jgi:putative addiction module component (TIGR02574 family)
MTVGTLVKEAKKLSTRQRWELVDELLELGADERADVALTPAQAADLDRRMEEARSGKEKLIPGDNAIAMLRKRMTSKKRARNARL